LYREKYQNTDNELRERRGWKVLENGDIRSQWDDVAGSKDLQNQKLYPKVLPDICDQIAQGLAARTREVRNQKNKHEENITS